MEKLKLKFKFKFIFVFMALIFFIFPHLSRFIHGKPLHNNGNANQTHIYLHSSCDKNRIIELLESEKLENYHNSYLPNTIYQVTIVSFAAVLTIEEGKAMEGLDYVFLRAQPDKHLELQPATFTLEFWNLSTLIIWSLLHQQLLL